MRPAGTVVATLGAVDPDAGETLHLCAGHDPSGKFEVVGNEVRVKAGASLDYEAATSHELTVTVTDAGGLEPQRGHSASPSPTRSGIIRRDRPGTMC